MKKEFDLGSIAENVGTAAKSAAKVACKKTGELAKLAKISLDIENQKAKLNKIYIKIGKDVVDGSLTDGKKETDIFKYIDEAKCEKEVLRELIEKKKQMKKNAENNGEDGGETDEAEKDDISVSFEE